MPSGLERGKGNFVVFSLYLITQGSNECNFLHLKYIPNCLTPLSDTVP